MEVGAFYLARKLFDLDDIVLAIGAPSRLRGYSSASTRESVATEGVTRIVVPAAEGWSLGNQSL